METAKISQLNDLHWPID